MGHWGKRFWAGVSLAKPLKSTALTKFPTALGQLLWPGISIKVDWGRNAEARAEEETQPCLLRATAGRSSILFAQGQDWVETSEVPRVQHLKRSSLSGWVRSSDLPP